MFSFYSLPSTAVKSKPLTAINAAYLFYYATTACPSCSNLGDGSVATPITHWIEETPAEKEILKERLSILIDDALMMAAKVSLHSLKNHKWFNANKLCFPQAGFDVLNALTIADNSLFLEPLKVSFFSV